MAARRYRDLPIRRKLAHLILGVAAASLLFAAAPLIGYAWFKSRESSRTALTTATRIAADNVTAALSFRDAGTAQQILASLRAEPGIDSACLYQIERPALFAAFSTHERCPDQPGESGLSEDAGGTVLVQPVMEGGDLIGWLRVRKNRNELS